MAHPVPADRHRDTPVTVRLSSGPDGDRAFVLAYAVRAGIAAETTDATIRAVIRLAVAEFRARHEQEVTGEPDPGPG
jgi:hypothetical protein